MAGTTERPRCSAYIAASVDRFIAGPNGEIDWLHAVDREGEDYGYAAHMATVDALVIGRGTYDVVAAMGGWFYTGKRVAVLTSRPPAAPIADETFHAEPLTSLLARLASEGVGHVYVDGGVVIRAALAAGVLDALTISWIPVLLGAGIPLFGGGASRSALTLVESRAFPSGLVQSRYAVG